MYKNIFAYIWPTERLISGKTTQLLMLLADSDPGSLLEAQIRVSLGLFVPMTSFMQIVGFTIMPSMKQHLVKNYF